MNAPRHFHVDRPEFFHPALPKALDGFRIVYISDLHVARGGCAEDELAHFLLSREYDLGLFGGDYQNGFGPVSEHAFGIIARIVRAVRARHGVYGCVGNHDSPDVVARLKSESIRMDENCSYEIAPGFHLVVIGDAWDRHDDVPLAMRDLPSSGFRMTLSHAPDVAWKASRAGAHALLCGHTHGGQVRLPFIDSPVKRIRGDRRLVRGDFRLDRMLLHVTHGFGTSLFAIRYGTRRSIAEVTLRHGELWKNAAPRIFSKETWRKLRSA
ncbi:MAG: metallophosphoesterase [Candidatus Hydrogenedentota bacterium]